MLQLKMYSSPLSYRAFRVSQLSLCWHETTTLLTTLCFVFVMFATSTYGHPIFTSVKQLFYILHKIVLIYCIMASAVWNGYIYIEKNKRGCHGYTPTPRKDGLRALRTDHAQESQNRRVSSILRYAITIKSLINSIGAQRLLRLEGL